MILYDAYLPILIFPLYITDLLYSPALPAYLDKLANCLLAVSAGIQPMVLPP